MKKVLFVSSFIGQKNTGGALASFRNLEICKSIFKNSEVKAVGFSFKPEDDVAGIKWLPSYKSKLATFLNYVSGYAGGLTKGNLTSILKSIATEKFDFVFLDGSLLGTLANKIKKEFPRIRVLTFFHNVEKDFFKDFCRQNRVYLPLYYSASDNERKTCNSSDTLLCFNERDANRIYELYGKRVDFLFPVTVKDTFSEGSINNNILEKDQPVQLLFLGSDFFANLHGVRWFCQNVMPSLNARLTVVGKGFEQYKEELGSEKIDVVGSVEETESYYYNAEVVVAPIFKGSGMKVKVAEALMFGKTVIGTSEAWQGYDKTEQQGFECNTVEEFVSAIDKFRERRSFYNPASRELFLEKYSFEVLQKTIVQVQRKLSLT